MRNKVEVSEEKEENKTKKYEMEERRRERGTRVRGMREKEGKK